MKYKPESFETVLDEWTEGEVLDRSWFVLVELNNGILLVRRWSKILSSWQEDERGTYVLRRLDYWRKKALQSRAERWADPSDIDPNVLSSARKYLVEHRADEEGPILLIRDLYDIAVMRCGVESKV